MKLNSSRFIGLLVCGILFVQVVAGFVVYLSLKSWADRANFGDMFGFVTALFSGLALAGVVVAILLQREELQLQREELKLTRTELKRSAEAQEETTAFIRKQLDAQVRPRFSFNSISMIDGTYTELDEQKFSTSFFFEIVILDHRLYDLQVIVSRPAELLWTHLDRNQPIVEPGSGVGVQIGVAGKVSQVRFSLIFTDISDTARRQEFQINGDAKAITYLGEIRL